MHTQKHEEFILYFHEFSLKLFESQTLPSIIPQQTFLMKFMKYDGEFKSSY